MFKKQLNKKSTKRIILMFWLSAVFLSFINTTFAQDLMEQAFSTARKYDTVIDIWSNKDSVWNTVLREQASIWINENFWQWCFINGQFKNINEADCNEQWGDWDIQAVQADTNPPLIVRITKFLLRMTIILSITMVIFNAVVYMVEVLNWKDWKSAEAKKNIMRVVWGIIIALMSVGIINLVVSIPKSSVKTSDEASILWVSCKIGTTILEWDALKKEICFNSTFGHPENTMPYREWAHQAAFSHSEDTMEDHIIWWYRCWICDESNIWCKWKKIHNSEMKEKCETDLNWTIIN